MRADLTEVVGIVDRSGSMDHLINESVGGLNNFLDAQRKLEGDVVFTLVAFDDLYEMPIDRVPLADVPPITKAMIQPRGWTALLDAIGRTINHIGARLAALPEHERPSKVVFAILTDGHENASTEFVPSAELQVKGTPKTQVVFDMIKHQTEKYNWQFLYLGANQDAISVGQSLGVSADCSVNFAASGAGVSLAYATIDSAVKSYRATGVMSASG